MSRRNSKITPMLIESADTDTTGEDTRNLAASGDGVHHNNKINKINHTDTNSNNSGHIVTFVTHSNTNNDNKCNNESTPEKVSPTKCTFTNHM